MNTRDTLKTELGVLADFNPKLAVAQQNSSYVFLGNTHPQVQLSVLKQIRKPKLVGLDTMNFWIEKTPSDLKRVISKIDVLIINDSEARELSHEANLLKAAKRVMGMTGKKGTLIIKQGEHGLLLFNRGMIFNLPGYPLEDVIDPTGAGDAFAGGFMGYLANADNASWDNLKTACVYGSVVASYCVEKFGTKRLQEIKNNDIEKRLKDFQKLAQF